MSAPVQSALYPVGPEAGHIYTLWLALFWTCLVVFVLVTGFLLYTLWRWKHTPAGAGFAPAPLAPPGQEERMTRTVSGAVVVTVLILFAILIASVATGKAVASFHGEENPLIVEVTGHQWWWQVRYPNPEADKTVVTANEIHVPVGRTVMIRGTSDDVIHSFWVPTLNGKRDLIPSRVTTLFFRADQPGTYRGQCAEFCGYQHAHMAFYVIAEPAGQFAAWLDHQVQPAPQPADPVLLRGRQVFLSQPCVLCHTIRGTGAFGQVAPDLTHVGSRKTIAAGTLPNTLGHLGGWVHDAQNIKPGNHMPTLGLKPDEVQPLLSYLESLQ